MAELIEAGSLIAGRYKLASLIGEGGMASVWRAEDQTLKRSVAIKLLYVRGQRDPQAIVDQFLREARIAASVQHRNVIHTVDFGIAAEQLPFMVMELLNGQSWADRMEQEPKLTMEEVVHLASLTLRGLGAVHEAGIVHRDLKPQNIFLHRDSDTVYPKILDFGISRSLAGDGALESAISTQDGMIVGTPDYMSPEQARGQSNIDKRADIYSMGAIIYEGITGRLPHEADTVGELIVKIVTTKPPTMREIRADVPQVLSDCVAQAMAHDREERFVDATVFRRALLSAAEKAFSTQLRRPVGSEAPPRMAVGAVSPAPVPVALGASKPVAGLQLPPSAAVNTTPAGNAWGDFEGLDGRAAKVVSQAAQDPALAAAVAAAQANKAAAPPKPAAVPIPLLGNAPSASAAAPFDSGMLGASPFDSLGASMGSGALDLDFERGMNIGTGVSADGSMPRPPRSPVQRSAVKNQRENLYAGGTGQAARGTAGAKRVAIAAQPQRRKERSGWSPIWILPIVLLLGLGLFVLAPELVSEPGPDVHAARDAEAKNPATSGSERHLQSARRKDLKNKPPALRDVTF